MFVDLLSKQKHNGAAARRFLLVLGAPFDARQLRGAFGVWAPSYLYGKVSLYLHGKA